jgi:hypothetical protein
VPPDQPEIPPGPDAAGEVRGIPEANEIADPRLLAEGWQCRFVAQGVRGDEMARLYRELGYDVLEVPLTPEMLGEECSDCRLVALFQFRLIYTRRDERAGGAASPP